MMAWIDNLTYLYFTLLQGCFNFSLIYMWKESMIHCMSQFDSSYKFLSVNIGFQLKISSKDMKHILHKFAYFFWNMALCWLWCLIDNKPLPEPMMTYYELDWQEQTQ